MNLQEDIQRIKEVMGINEQTSNQNFFKGWTQEEINFYNSIPKDKRDDDYYGYTPEEVHDSIKTRMSSAKLSSDVSTKMAQGLVQLGSDPGYSRPKTENAGEAKDQNWYKKFPCINESNSRANFEGTPAVADMTLANNGITTYYFYDGSLALYQKVGQPITKFWYCNGNTLQVSNDSKYNVWVPKSDPRSQAEKFVQSQ